MTREAILESVLSVLTCTLGFQPDEPTPDYSEGTNLLDDTGLDSLDFVDFLFGIEGLFDIRIADEEAEKFMPMTIGELVDYLMGVKLGE